MSENEQQLNCLLKKIRDFLIEVDKGPGINKLDDFRRLESIRLGLSKEIDEIIERNTETK